MFLNVHAKNVDLCYPQEEQGVRLWEIRYPRDTVRQTGCLSMLARYTNDCFLEDLFPFIMAMVVGVQAVMDLVFKVSIVVA